MAALNAGKLKMAGTHQAISLAGARAAQWRRRWSADAKDLPATAGDRIASTRTFLILNVHELTGADVRSVKRAHLVCVLSLPLAGCSYLGMEQGTPPPALKPTAMEPPSPAAVKTNVVTAAASAKITDGLEVSRPLRSQPSNLEPWMVCFRGRQKDAQRTLQYSAYFTADTMGRFQMSSINESCEDQPYTAVK